MITVYDLILINIWMYLYTYFYTLSFPKLVGPEQQTLSLRLSTGNDVFWDDAGVNHLVALTVDGRNLAPLREIESKLYKRNIMQRKTENVHSPGHGWLLNNISVIFILEIPNVYAACIQRTPPPHMSSQSSHHPMPWNDSRQQHRPDAASIDALLACRGALYNPAMIDYWYIVWLWTNIPKKTCIVIVTFVLFQNIFVT